MSLWFQPKPRSVVYCDFTGFRAPEMSKRRPVIVLRAHKRNRRLVYVVPLSTTPPEPMQPYHYHFRCSPAAPGSAAECWAKCDMLALVSIDRLTVGRVRPAYQSTSAARSLLMISNSEHTAIRQCVAIALGLGRVSYVCDGTPIRAADVVDGG